MVEGKVSQTSQDPARLVFTAVVHQLTRREGHGRHTEEEDVAGDDLDADGDEPGGVTLVVELSAADEIGTVVDPERDHDAEGDGELLQRNEGSTDFWG